MEINVESYAATWFYSGAIGLALCLLGLILCAVANWVYGVPLEKWEVLPNSDRPLYLLPLIPLVLGGVSMFISCSTIYGYSAVQAEAARRVQLTTIAATQDYLIDQYPPAEATRLHVERQLTPLAATQQALLGIQPTPTPGHSSGAGWFLIWMLLK